MSTTAFSPRAYSGSRAAKSHPVVSSRKLAAAILTSGGVALAIVFGLLFGGFGLFSIAFSLSLPIALIWGGADVVRADEALSP